MAPRSYRLASIAIALLALACDAPSHDTPRTRPGRELNSPLPSAAARNETTGTLHAVLINGGGNPAKNYQSHVLHLRKIIATLTASGIDADHITVFASDGTAPESDLAVKDSQPEKDFWLIEGLDVGRSLATKVRLENTLIRGAELLPATKGAIRRWFDRAAKNVAAEDRVFLYVTDHGSKNEADNTNNSIVLWNDESLSVDELRDHLAKLPAETQIATVMSQCFSGGFANVALERKSPPVPLGNVCGYFSSTPDRFAYGCYPENKGKDNVGHGFRFVEGFNLDGDLEATHARLLLTDRTPDVPNRTSDYYLQALLREEARKLGLRTDAFIDQMLRQAWQDEHAYAEDFLAIDRLGAAFGSSGPRSIADLGRIDTNLPNLARKLKSYSDRWSAALQSRKQELLADFLEANAFWRDYLQAPFLNNLDNDKKREIAAWLLDDLKDHATGSPELWSKLTALRTFAEEARAAAYRMEVRLGTRLRMRILLTRIAGLVYLEQFGSNLERAGFEELASCESFVVERGRKPSRREFDLPPPFPPMIEEMELIAGVLPGWLGVEFESYPERLRVAASLPDGAVRITRVIAGSPAAESGLKAGDIIVGPPGRPFASPGRFREWALTTLIDEIQPMEILRGEHYMVLDLRVGVPPVP